MGRYSIEMMTLLERPVLTMSNNSIQILTYSSLEKQIVYWLILGVGSFNCKAKLDLVIRANFQRVKIFLAKYFFKNPIKNAILEKGSKLTYYF